MKRNGLSIRLRAAIALAKAIPHLRPIDERYAHVPFPYDANFFAELRPDQVARYAGCLTHPERLETRTLPLRSLIATQDRIDGAKVQSMAAQAKLGGGNPVVIRNGDRDYSVDGHHRASVAFLHGDRDIEVQFKDLTANDMAVK